LKYATNQFPNINIASEIVTFKTFTNKIEKKNTEQEVFELEAQNE